MFFAINKKDLFALGFVFRFLGCLGFKGHPDRIPLVPRGRPWPPARWPPPPPLTTHMPSNLPLVCAGMSTSTTLHILFPVLVHCTQMDSVSATSAKCAKLVIKFNYCKITLQKKYLNNFFRLLCLWLSSSRIPFRTHWQCHIMMLLLTYSRSNQPC